MQHNWKLNPEAVRKRAASIQGCREVPSESPVLCSFLVGFDGERDAEKLARVNIFVDTGTVATCRILQGEVRHTFRRNVSSLDTIERLLRDPPTLTTIDDHLVGLSDSPSSSSTQRLSVKAQLDLADVGLAILHGEKEKLELHLESLDDQQSTPVSSASKSENSESSCALSGTEFQFSLEPKAMKQVDKCLSEIQSMGKLVRTVATNGKGSVFLYGNGGVAYTPHIPRALYQKLSQLRKSAFDRRPSYVSLGTRDRFFVSFYDETFSFKGPKGLDRELKKVSHPPQCVSFGSTYDTFFVVFQDGSWTYEGKGIPIDLQEKLDARREKGDLKVCNLGPEGEWYLRARNGRMWWGGVSADLDAAVQDLLDTGHKVNFIDFGEDCSYFLSYD